ncbi:ImmA/IrrE family metallo-endopeptidase [Rhodospirillum rubrum]|uniref:Plasmid maintenance system antidote protein n=1 Tax=Rhodospirillum rubrum (strain ATCC 11170 / ATH 1.1.1 / DSM 467 / LMG 4362 / NCIMB 8255 / S1) TaxID=269796 RepID=Q2RYI4_RHORT|nr:ImmA/IrrE family metallo-endopeptidase [Rhodospirillum rubrum]ABC20811.1 Plasmid maintenance system antidote protein [Rhodospirillum rubrum ATCC 11170]AEO46477.1 plasmid maintenance system antidote protein [Rhodospirillum rubrum F11]MBK5956334.1 XRE family transcriptional regulator [Rhodospirillum rubrum]QXG80516.1 ImmA/IrrE family metallo-endopeptidase [Rhodospirillum rubrum]HCF18737.1 ImmA/IrrE family metallo-endopeptidase [Rhodospirillum rubrum]
MEKAERLTGTPDYAVLPGRILDKTLAGRGLQKAEFAERCGHSAKMISEIIAGKAPIMPETALEFERVLGMPASYWLTLESLYRLRLAEQRDRQRLSDQRDWAKRFPIAAMVRLGWIDKPSDRVDEVAKLLAFFGVASVEAWQAMTASAAEQIAYRRSPSFQSAPESVSAWLRRGEMVAGARPCGPFDEAGFRRVLKSVRELTREAPEVFQPSLIERCACVGVAVVFTPELPKTCLSGATRWLSKDKALIQLSLRHKTDDHLWFTFFHEAGHVLLHPKKLILEEKLKKGEAPTPESAQREREANVFAATTLIPRSAWMAFTAAGDFSAPRIRAFAKEHSLSPGIIVGQLQHDSHLSYATTLNSLKTTFRWPAESAVSHPSV